MSVPEPAVPVRLYREGQAPEKKDCPGHVAGRDEIGRYPIGDCGPDCLLRRYRLGRAVWDAKNARWT